MPSFSRVSVSALRRFHQPSTRTAQAYRQASPLRTALLRRTALAYPHSVGDRIRTCTMPQVPTTAPVCGAPRPPHITGGRRLIIYILPAGSDLDLCQHRFSQWRRLHPGRRPASLIVLPSLAARYPAHRGVWQTFPLLQTGPAHGAVSHPDGLAPEPLITPRTKLRPRFFTCPCSRYVATPDECAFQTPYALHGRQLRTYLRFARQIQALANLYPRFTRLMPKYPKSRKDSFRHQSMLQPSFQGSSRPRINEAILPKT